MYDESKFYVGQEGEVAFCDDEINTVEFFIAQKNRGVA